MKTLIRWSKFNLVGVLGMAVQLTVLALLNRRWPGHYLWTSGVALEVTLLHNFVWHQRFTWCDRSELSQWPRQLLRFHLSSGLVSLVGNLALMRVLVHDAQVPIVISNIIAIMSCSILNFYAGNRWAFVATEITSQPNSNTENLTNLRRRMPPQRHDCSKVQIEVRT